MASVEESERFDPRNVVKRKFYLGLRHPEAGTEEEAVSRCSEAEKQALRQIYTAYGDQLISVIPMNDRSHTKGLGGHAQVLHPDTVLDPSVSFKKEMFGVTIMVPVTQYLPRMSASEREKHVEVTLTKKLHKVLEKTCSVEQFATLAMHYRDRGEVDALPWMPHWHSGRVAFYYIEVGKEKLYYLGFRCCTVGKSLTKELKQIVIAEKLTARQICCDARFLWAQNLSLRNVGRMIYNIFYALKWDVHHAVEDTLACVPKHHVCPRYFQFVDSAVFPTSYCVYNTFSPILSTVNQTIEAIALFLNCTHAQMSSGAALIHGNESDTISEYHGKKVSHHSHKVTNQVYGALPLFYDEAADSDTIRASYSDPEPIGADGWRRSTRPQYGQSQRRFSPERRPSIVRLARQRISPRTMGTVGLHRARGIEYHPIHPLHPAHPYHSSFNYVNPPTPIVGKPSHYLDYHTHRYAGGVRRPFGIHEGAYRYYNNYGRFPQGYGPPLGIPSHIWAYYLLYGAFPYGYAPPVSYSPAYLPSQPYAYDEAALY